jgi:hypothetical protein
MKTSRRGAECARSPEVRITGTTRYGLLDTAVSGMPERDFGTAGMVAGAARRDTRTTMYAIPLQRSAPPLADDAYSAWFNAQQRCSAALRAWRAAPQAGRADAHRAYIVELAVEELAAGDLARLHRQRLAV